VTWLIDKSALVRVAGSPDGALWSARTAAREVHITVVTRLELGFSARSAGEHEQVLGSAPISTMPVEHLTPDMEDRAEEVQRLLARTGHHRAPSVADLLIAATAELRGLTLLHVDKDFGLIAKQTGQPVERLRI
jgi:predicted nucleic acid-binding protein